MSSLAKIYKQAHDTVLKRYENESEDKWKVVAIAKCRAGERGHETVMFQFVKDVEQETDNLLSKLPKVVTPAPVSKGIEVAETVSPSTPPH